MAVEVTDDPLGQNLCVPRGLCPGLLLTVIQSESRIYVALESAQDYQKAPIQLCQKACQRP